MYKYINYLLINLSHSFVVQMSFVCRHFFSIFQNNQKLLKIFIVGSKGSFVLGVGRKRNIKYICSFLRAGQPGHACLAWLKNLFKRKSILASSRGLILRLVGNMKKGILANILFGFLRNF